MMILKMMKTVVMMGLECRGICILDGKDLVLWTFFVDNLCMVLREEAFF